MLNGPIQYNLKNVSIPIGYKKGFVKFLNCKIDLSKRVFIPRIETEYWVRKAIEDIRKSKDNSQKLKILDIFAGSGCIGIAILKNVKNSQVDFIDIDKKAVAQIKINLKLNKISPKRYKIYHSDFFEKLEKKKSSQHHLIQRYDIVFANPPYVAKERLKEVGASVLKYEPKIAFLAGKKGIYHIKKFLKTTKKFLKKSGVVYLEFDPKQKREIKKILEEPEASLQFCDFKFLKDQFKKYRFAKIKA